MDNPSAIVLSQTLTGLSTVRGIAAGGIDVHAASFEAHEPIHYTRHCRIVKLTGLRNNENELLLWLKSYAHKLGNRPIVIPTSDAHALMLAQHYDELKPFCRMWTTDYATLNRIINKSHLHNIAIATNIEIIPTIQEPTTDQIEKWSQANAAPYLLKPFYEGIAFSNLDQKNLILPTRNSLVDYVRKNGSKALLVQRMIQGGDGHIFDCYGLCDATGKLLTMASHRRWRQKPPDVGTTTYGEIPAKSIGNDELVLFDNTTRLLNSVRYHGIFGIEWLQERSTGKYYLIDFNARPFTSIGHLSSCGLNLPLLAYQELVGVNLSHLSPVPALKHKYWIDFLRDVASIRLKKRNGIFQWLGSLLSCRCFAYFDLLDPGPAIYRSWQIFNSALQFLWKRLKRNLFSEQAQIAPKPK